MDLRNVTIDEIEHLISLLENEDDPYWNELKERLYDIYEPSKPRLTTGEKDGL